jgi:kynurenine formamidase
MADALPSDDALPSYDELPVVDGAPPGSAWGLWGADDVFGALNLLTPDRVRAGAACVRKGAVFPLNLELELPSPALFGRSGPEHIVIDHGGGFHDDVLSGWNTQSSSQWDGFRHVAHPQYGHWNGVADESHGMQHWARRGIAGRGVLADVARWRASVGRPIDPGAADVIEADDVLATLAAQRVTVEPGDILLVRTGWIGWYRSLAAEGRNALAGRRPTSCGLRPGRDTARMLWDLHVAALACDNPAVEVWPPSSMDEAGFAHLVLLPLLGLPLGELWDLDRLADDCAADGVFTCQLTAAPLNVDGGVGSPANAIAMK